MAESTFSFASPQSLIAAFDLPALTSDGGMPWLTEADARRGPCAALAGPVPEWRHGPVYREGVANRGPARAELKAALILQAERIRDLTHYH